MTNMFIQDDRIKPYQYKGLQGRYIFQPAKYKKSKRVFLVVYGQHATIERLIPTVEALSEFGAVYLVDTPGFGGMDPPYMIGEEPTLDFYSDHLKNIFDILLPRDKKITLFAISFGLQLTTVFLCKNPEYITRVEDHTSFVGLVSHTNFRISKSLEILLKYFVTGPGKTRHGAWIYQKLILRDQFLKFYYRHIMAPKNPQLKGASKNMIQAYVSEQSWLWRINDPRTHARTAWDFLFLTDLTDRRVGMRITHIGVPNDHFLDDTEVVKGLRKIYLGVDEHDLHMDGHTPVSMDSANDVLELIPDVIKSKMSSSVN